MKLGWVGGGELIGKNRELVQTLEGTMKDTEDCATRLIRPPGAILQCNYLYTIL